jgi:hypothetical protein
MGKKIRVNKEKLTEEEFAQKKEELEGKKGVKLVEVRKNVYKIQIQG